MYDLEENKHENTNNKSGGYMWVTIPDYHNYEVNIDRKSGVLVRRKKLPRRAFTGGAMTAMVRAKLIKIVNNRYHLTHHMNRETKSFLADDIYEHAINGAELIPPHLK